MFTLLAFSFTLICSSLIEIKREMGELIQWGGISRAETGVLVSEEISESELPFLFLPGFLFIDFTFVSRVKLNFELSFSLSFFDRFLHYFCIEGLLAC